MKNLRSILIFSGLALTYHAGLAFAIGLSARLGPSPSANAVISQGSYLVAVLVVALPVAAALVHRFGGSAPWLALLLGGLMLMDSIWSNEQLRAVGIVPNHPMMVFNLLPVLLSPMILSGLYLQFCSQRRSQAS